MRSPWVLVVSTALLVACSSGPSDRLLGTDCWEGCPGGGGGAEPGSPAGGGGGGTGGDGGGGGPSPQAQEPALVSGLSISEIAAFQTVKVPLVKGGAPASSLAPLVAQRATMLRVYVTPEAGWIAKPVKATLTLDTGGQRSTYDATLSPATASTDGDLSSTFNFDLPAAAISETTTFSVALRDPATMAAPPGPAPRTSRHPADGSLAPLRARSSGGQLKIVLVPMLYGADGSNRAPDTSNAQIDRYTRTMLDLYPVGKISLTVRQPITTNIAIAAGGGGWNQMLTTLISLRAQDGAAPDVYYYGVFAPAASMAAYCGGGCVAGLSPLIANPMDAQNRASIGLGFTGDSAAHTMAHEIGHAHGRPHAPCGGVAGADPSYPHTGGGIGLWGWSLSQKQLVSPAQTKDMMSYCTPSWFSDYTEGALFDRIKAVNGAAIVPTAPTRFMFAGVDGDGTVRVAGDAMLTTRPGGDERTVRYVDASGAELGRATAFFTPHDHLPGGTLVVPASPPGTSRIELVRDWTSAFAPAAPL
jgi:hypothetical protein